MTTKLKEIVTAAKLVLDDGNEQKFIVTENEVHPYQRCRLIKVEGDWVKIYRDPGTAVTVMPVSRIVYLECQP